VVNLVLKGAVSTKKPDEINPAFQKIHPSWTAMISCYGFERVLSREGDEFVGILYRPGNCL